MTFGIERISTLMAHVKVENKPVDWNALNEEQRVNVLMNIEGTPFVDALKCTDGNSPVLFQFSDENKIKLLNRLSTTYPTQMRSVLLQKNAYKEMLFDFIDEKNQARVTEIIHIAAHNAKDIHIKMAARKVKERK